MSEIFLVEDSDLDTMVFERVMELSSAKSEVKNFSRATACITELKKRQLLNSPLPQLIVLDIFLDGERGEMVLDYIEKEIPHGIPVIVLSASMGLIDESSFKLSETLKLLAPKPFTTAKLNHWMDSKLIA